MELQLRELVLQIVPSDFPNLPLEVIPAVETLVATGELAGFGGVLMHLLPPLNY